MSVTAIAPIVVEVRFVLIAKPTAAKTPPMFKYRRTIARITNKGLIKDMEGVQTSPISDETNAVAEYSMYSQLRNRIWRVEPPRYIESNQH